MRRAALLLVAASLSAAVLDAQGAPPRKRENVISLAEIKDELAHEKPLNVLEVVTKARPRWYRFANYGRSPTQNQATSPSEFRPAPGPLEFLYSGCSGGFSVYLDNEQFVNATQLEAWDIAEIRLIEPHQVRTIGDSLIRTANCGALHVVSLGAWFSMQNPAEALDALQSVGDVTLEQMDIVFKTFGLTWRPEAPNLVVYEHPARKACGDFRRPTDPTWDLLPGAMRDRAIILLNCVRSRENPGNAIFIGSKG